MLAHAPVQQESLDQALRVGDLAAMTGKINLSLRPSALLERADVVAHIALGWGDTLVFQPITWSPENRTSVPSSPKHRWSGAWPGVCTAVKAQPSPASRPPSASGTSGTKS